MVAGLRRSGGAGLTGRRQSPFKWQVRRLTPIIWGKERSDEEANVAQLGKGRRITGDERGTLTEDLRKSYESGRSIRAISAETGRSYGFVHRVLVESGTTLRGRGGATTGKG